MILTSSIITSLNSLLDDNSSGRYNDVHDYIPAINSAVDFIVAVFTAAFEQKRVNIESLSELITTYVASITLETNMAKIDLDAHANINRDDIWTIFGIDPKPTVDSSIPVEFKDSSKRWATKLTLAEWNDASGDPFSPGTTQDIPAEFMRISYIGPGRFFNDNKEYILIRPASYFTAGDKVALWVLLNPTKVTGPTSEINFPRSLENLIAQKALQYISMQQGGAQSPYMAVTNKEVTDLVNIMNS